MARFITLNAKSGPICINADFIVSFCRYRGNSKDTDAVEFPTYVEVSIPEGESFRVAETAQQILDKIQNGIG